MKIYAPNTHGENGISGGHTFYRNFRKGMAEKVHFVDSWQECDVFFITGITIVDISEVQEAKKAGKKIVLRVDNVPRKSRNRRSTPHQRLKEIAEISDVVIYQSEWAKDYCRPLCGDGVVIYNGVDQSIFKPNYEIQNKNHYVFAYHGKNEQKNFWEAWLRFQYIFRSNPNATFEFIYDFGTSLSELEAARYDFWQGESYIHSQRKESPEEMAEFFQRAGGGLIYPSICDASPNVVLEARSCDCPILYPADKELSGTQELLEIADISSERMCEEYYGVFKVLGQEIEQQIN